MSRGRHGELQVDHRAELPPERALRECGRRPVVVQLVPVLPEPARLLLPAGARGLDEPQDTHTETGQTQPANASEDVDGTQETTP